MVKCDTEPEFSVRTFNTHVVRFFCGNTTLHRPPTGDGAAAVLPRDCVFISSASDCGRVTHFCPALIPGQLQRHSPLSISVPPYRLVRDDSAPATRPAPECSGLLNPQRDWPSSCSSGIQGPQPRDENSLVQMCGGVCVAPLLSTSCRVCQSVILLLLLLRLGAQSLSSSPTHSAVSPLLTLWRRKGEKRRRNTNHPLNITIQLRMNRG